GRVHLDEPGLDGRLSAAGPVHGAVLLERVDHRPQRAEGHRRRPVGLRSIPGMGDLLPAPAPQLHLAAEDPFGTSRIRRESPRTARIRCSRQGDARLSGRRMSRFLVRVWRRYRDTPLFVKMTVGFVLGLIVAFVFGEQAQVLSPIGDVLLNLLQLIVIPIIMVTLIDAVNNTRPGNLVRVAFKTFAFYILTTIAAVVISLALALLINPGTGLHRPEKSAETPDAPSFVDQLVSIFPDNIFKALADGNILALIFVSMVIGLTLAGMRRSTEETISGFGKLVYDLVLAAKEMTFRI